MIFVIILFDAGQFLSAKFPTSWDNTSFIPFSGVGRLNYVEGDWKLLYNTGEGSFFRICPNTYYQMSFINEKGETMALLYEDTIFNTEYETIYKIVDSNLYYPNNTFISRFRYDFYLDNYVFSDINGEVIGMVIMDGKDFLLNFSNTVDARLYKTFLANMYYTDGPWSEFFFWNIMLIMSLLVVIFVISICSCRRKRAQTDLTQQLVPM